MKNDLNYSTINIKVIFINRNRSDAKKKELIYTQTIKIILIKNQILQIIT